MEKKEQNHRWILIVSVAIIALAILIAIVFSVVSSNSPDAGTESTVQTDADSNGSDPLITTANDEPTTHTTAPTTVNPPSTEGTTPSAPVEQPPETEPSTSTTSSSTQEPPVADPPPEEPSDDPVDPPQNPSPDDTPDSSPDDTPNPEPDDTPPAEEPAFVLDVSANKNAADSNIIDVVISIKDIRQTLDAIEFTLLFDRSYVSGLITESGTAMDAFMTVVPMYTLSASGMEFPLPRYEQICSYDAEQGAYICRFLDSLTYPSAKPGETYTGLVNDGDIVITISFQIIENIPSNTEISFTVEEVRGTTRGTFESVTGMGASDAYLAP